MFENSPAVELTIGRSSVRQRILALLMDEAGGRLHLREIQRRASTSPGTASRELARLVAAGLIERDAEGNQVYFRVSGSPMATMLRSLLVAMPAPVSTRPPRMPRPRTVKASKPAASLGSDSVAVSTAEEAARVFGVVPPISDLPLGATGVPTTDPTAETAQPKASGSPDRVGLAVAGRFAESIRSIYGEALRGVYLHGARATGPASADADVETIVVLDRVEHYGAELERTSHICAELSHESQLVVSRLFVSEASWNGGLDGKLPSVRSEAVAV